MEEKIDITGGEKKLVREWFVVVVVVVVQCMARLF